MMASGLLSLKWNNHRSTFFHVLSTIRSKESYCDVTLACDGRFYSLHKFVLSTCSEYFEEMFERTQCKHPVIVLKDIKYDDLEALLNYMYVGEVNVVQEKLAGLIKAAECLKIKGLAVPDEDPMENKDNISREQNKRSQRSDDSPRPKRRRRENSSDVAEEIISPVRSRPRNREQNISSQAANNNNATSEDNRHHEGREEDAPNDTLEEAENSSINANRQTDSNANRSISSSHKKEHIPEEVTLDDDGVKAEPIDMENDDHADGGDEENQDNKDSLHQELGFDATDSMGADDDSYADVDPSMLGGQPQSVEDVVNQAMPGSSGFQGNSFPMWEGEGSLSNFPVEGFSGDNSQARQMDCYDEHCAQPRQGRPLHYDDHKKRPLDTTTNLHNNNNNNNTSLCSNDSEALIIHDPPAVYHSIDSLTQSQPLNKPQEGKGSASLPSLYNVFKLTNGECYRQCSLCNYSAPTSSRMLDHIKSHTGEKPFVCVHPNCSKTFTRKFSLHAHLRLHTGEKPFLCNVCNRSFSTNSILTCHLRTHTGEKPYACPHCSYRSTQRTALKVHMRNTHNDFLT